MKERVYKAVFLLGIQLRDFCREELIHAFIHPSHEPVLLPVLRWSTVDLLRKEVEESETMSRHENPKPIIIISFIF